MSANETAEVMAAVLEADRREDGFYRPIVAIGHTKDLDDLGTADTLLAFLSQNDISVSTFTEIYPKLVSGKTQQISSGAAARTGTSEPHAGGATKV
jgi:hypothetical protein